MRTHEDGGLVAWVGGEPTLHGTSRLVFPFNPIAFVQNHEEPHVEANQNLVPQTFDEGAFETFFRLAPRGQAPAAGTGPAE